MRGGKRPVPGRIETHLPPTAGIASRAAGFAGFVRFDHFAGFVRFDRFADSDVLQTIQDLCFARSARFATLVTLEVAPNPAQACTRPSS